ncbi:hypothetical protein CR513_40796, partial [Mucuna pruriens]
MSDTRPRWHIANNWKRQKSMKSPGCLSPGAMENDKRTLRRLAVGFFLSGVILYKRSADLTLLRCVDDREA